MSKKKTKRDREKYPDLNEKTTLKLRRDYIDNRHYVNGVKGEDKKIIPELKLKEKDKEYLNQFNKEYYGNSFHKKDKLRVNIEAIEKDEVFHLKNQIREIKAKRKKIFDKSPNKTTEKDREQARIYNKQIEDIEEFIKQTYPQQLTSDLNNARNRCFFNRNKASNEIKLVSWETLEEDSIIFNDPELYYQYILDKKKDD